MLSNFSSAITIRHNAPDSCALAWQRLWRHVNERCLYFLCRYFWSKWKRMFTSRTDQNRSSRWKSGYLFPETNMLLAESYAVDLLTMQSRLGQTTIPRALTLYSSALTGLHTLQTYNSDLPPFKFEDSFDLTSTRSFPRNNQHLIICEVSMEKI